MGTDFVISLHPTIGDFPNIGDRVEQEGVEHLFPVGPIEPLDERVLVGFAWLDESQFDVMLLAPFGEGVAGQLRPVVAADCLGLAMDLDQLFDETDHSQRRYGRRNIDAQTFPVRLVDHIERADRSPAVQRVMHEVQRPHGIHLRHDDHRLPGAARQPPLGTPLVIEPQLAINPIDLFMVPGATHRPQAVETLPETPAHLHRHDLVQGIDDFAVAFAAIDPRLVIRRPR